jgi:hypothetical protein
MKRIILGCVLLVAGCSASAQLVSVITTMEGQIAALKAYADVAEKGYSLAEKGLQTIGEIKKGEFNLHSVYFNSLAVVNGKVAGMSEVGEIISMQTSMIRQFSQKLGSYRQSAGLQPAEVAYITQVYTTLVSTAQAEITALTNLLTDGALVMTDGERTLAIQSIDVDTKQQYRFFESFTNQADILAQQRQQDSVDIGSIKGMYGLP